jgi:hypothetical protein
MMLGAIAPPAVAQAPELSPDEEGFSCRASSARLATGTGEDASRLEPFVANRDVFPCVDADAGVPSLTQLPPPEPGAEPGPGVILGGAFARTRDGELEPEAPPPPEEEGVIFADAGAANVVLTDGEQVIIAEAVRATARVRCVDGQPVFESSSEIVGLTLGGPEPTLILPPPDDPATPEDESHVDIPDEEGPIHIGHSTTTTDPATGITTHTRRALWLENGEDGSEGEIVVGEASVDVRGNPCTGRVTVVKNAVPDDPQDFSFTGLTTVPFVLDDDPASADPPRARTFDLAPGAYTVAEVPVAGFQLRDVSCVGDEGATAAPNGATVDLQADEDVTCTFLNISDAICPPGSVLNDQGQCVRTETQCPPGSTFNDQGQCVVAEITCPPGSTAQGGECVANETACPPGSTFSPQGQCVVTETQCPAGSVRNELGQCVSTQIVAEDVPRGGVVVPLADVPGADDSLCSRPGFGANVAIVGTNRGDRITGTNQSDRIFAFGGRDRVSGGRGNDCVEGGSGNDNLDGSNGADALLGDVGRDILNGGTGRDRLEGGAAADKLIGGSGSDRMIGGNGIDKLSGGLGNDRLEGGGSRDYIEGGHGADRVSGGSGNDAINVAESGPRRDVVDCGPGRDVVRIDVSDRIRNCERVLVLRSPRRR